jgi:hypothetical protein
LKNGNEIIHVDPAPGANLCDHDFLSPTFDSILEDSISDFIKEYGDKK